MELYAALLLGAGAVLVMQWRRIGRPPPGVIGAVALAIAAGARWATEPMRPSLTSTLWPWYAGATAAGILAAVFLLIRAARSRRSFSL